MFTAAHLHPMTVHFPIVLIMIGFIVDLICLFTKKQPWLAKTGFWLMIAGTLAAITAYLTGSYFTNELTGKAHELQESHELFAGITMWLMVAASVIRIFLLVIRKNETGLKYIVFVLYFFAFIFVAFTGFLGGSLVYNFMIK